MSSNINIIKVITEAWSKNGLKIYKKELKTGSLSVYIAEKHIGKDVVFSVVFEDQGILDTLIIGVYLYDLEETFKTYTKWEEDEFFNGELDVFTSVEEQEVHLKTQKTYYYSLFDDIPSIEENMNSKQVSSWLQDNLTRVLDVHQFQNINKMIVENFSIESIPAYSRSTMLLIKWIVRKLTDSHFTEKSIEQALEKNKALIPAHKFSSLYKDLCKFKKDKQL